MLRGFARTVAGLFCLFSAPSSAQEGYTANISVVIDSVITYTDSSNVVFTIKGSSPLICATPYWIIPDTVTEERRQVVVSRLLLAYSSGESVNIGYDGRACVGDGLIRVYRVG